MAASIAFIAGIIAFVLFFILGDTVVRLQSVMKRLGFMKKMIPLDLNTDCTKVIVQGTMSSIERPLKNAVEEIDSTVHSLFKDEKFALPVRSEELIYSHVKIEYGTYDSYSKRDQFRELQEEDTWCECVLSYRGETIAINPKSSIEVWFVDDELKSRTHTISKDEMKGKQKLFLREWGITPELNSSLRYTEHFIYNQTELTVLGRYNAETKTLSAFDDEHPLIVSPVSKEVIQAEVHEGIRFALIQFVLLLLCGYFILRPFISYPF